jgi:O-antigen/teichoic acid export membrane protein
MRHLLTASSAFQIFHVLRQISILLTAILLAKSGIDEAEIGNYEMLMFVLFSISFFWVNGLTQGFLTLYPRKNTVEQAQLFFQIFLFFFIISLIATTLLFLGQYPISYVLTKQTELSHFNLFLIYLFLNIPTYLVETIYLLKNKAIPIVYFAILSFGVHLLVILIPIYLGYTFKESFIGLIGLALVKFIWIAYLQFKYARIHFNYSLLWELLKLSSPLVIYSLLGGFAQVFDSWLVGWYYDGDQKQFAIFRYGARELPLTLAVATAFSHTILPKVAVGVEASLNELKKKSTRLLHFFFPLSILMAIFSKQLYIFFFSVSFIESAGVFSVYLLILINRFFFPHTLLIGLDQNNFMMKISIVELFINVLSSIFLIQYMGLMGIAMGTVIAYTFEKIVYAIYLKQKFNIRIHQYTNVKWLGLYSVLLIAAVIFGVVY